MKKALFAVICVMALTFVSCGQTASTTEGVDSTAVDSVAVDSAVVDSTVVDSVAVDSVVAVVEDSVVAE